MGNSAGLSIQDIVTATCNKQIAQHWEDAQREGEFWDLWRYVDKLCKEAAIDLPFPLANAMVDACMCMPEDQRKRQLENMACAYKISTRSN